MSVPVSRPTFHRGVRARHQLSRGVSVPSADQAIATPGGAMSARYVLLHGENASVVDAACYDQIQALCSKPPITKCPWRSVMDDEPVALLNVDALDELEQKLDDEYRAAKAALSAARELA